MAGKNRTSKIFRDPMRCSQHGRPGLVDASRVRLAATSVADGGSRGHQEAALPPRRVAARLSATWQPRPILSGSEALLLLLPGLGLLTH